MPPALPSCYQVSPFAVKKTPCQKKRTFAFQTPVLFITIFDVTFVFRKTLKSFWAAFGLSLLLALFATSAFAQEIAAPDRRAFADGLMSRGLVELALPEYRALAADAATPERDVVLYRLAECARQTGALADAEKACAELLAKYPKSEMAPRASLTRGLILKASGKNAEAASVLAELATDPDAPAELTATALYHSAEARENSGNRKGAETRYTELIKRAAAPGAAASVRELGAYAELRATALQALEDTPEARNAALSRYNAVVAKPFSPRVGAEALFQSAALLYRMDKFAESAAKYAQLAAKYPKDMRVADARIPAAWANYRAGRYADALAAAKPLAETDGPSQIEAAYLKANSLAQLGQRKDAVAAYDALLALPGGKARDLFRSARYERLVVLFKDGAFQQVLDDAAHITDPPDEVLDDFIWLQAQAAEALKDEARAVQFYRMLAERRPDSRLAPDALYRLAYRLQGQEAWLEASRAYLSLAKSFPENGHVPQALYSSGLCLAKAGRDAEAIRDWNDLLARFQNDATASAARFQKAMAEIRGNLRREAAEDLDEILSQPAKVHPSKLAEASFWRARLFYDAKEFSAAEKRLRESLKWGPADDIRAEASFLLGLALQAQGRDAEAATCFQPLLAASSTSSKFTDDRLAWLSEFQFSRKQYAAARDAAQELAKRSANKEWVQAGNTLAGRAYAALSDTNSAIAAFRLAADSPVRTKYSSEAALRLGELLAAQGDDTALAEAADYLGEAVARASSPELVAIRAKAYFALADCTAKRGKKEAAARYYMAVALLFDDKDIVPAALVQAEALYTELGMTRESEAAKAERQARYPAKDGK